MFKIIKRFLVASSIAMLFLAPYVYATPTITEYPVTQYTSPNGLTAGPDGNLWFTEENGNNIGKITRVDRLPNTLYQLPIVIPPI